MPALSILAHHSEPSDPVLLRWVLETFDAILGYGPWAMIIPVAIVVVGFPVALAVLALRSRRGRVGADKETPAEEAKASVSESREPLS